MSEETCYEKIAATREQLFKVLYYIIDIDDLDEYEKVIKDQNSMQQSLYGFFTIHERFVNDDLTAVLRDMAKIVPKIKEIEELIKGNRILSSQVILTLQKITEEKEL